MIMDEFFPKMKFTLVYNDITIPIIVNRNKLINYLLNQAYTLFNIKGSFTLFYKNKDLSPYYEKEIGSYFQTLRHVHILIKDKHNSRNCKSLPSISRYAEVLTQSKRALSKCSQCKVYKINFYCRDCGVFLCKNCRMKKEAKHYSHRTVTLYPEDLNKSAILYREVVNGDLYEALNARNQMKTIKEDDVDIDQLTDSLQSKLDVLFQTLEAYQKSSIDIDKYSFSKDNITKEINDTIQVVKHLYCNEHNLLSSFETINQMESKISNYTSINRKLTQWDKTNSTIEESLKKVERKIYSVLSTALNEQIENVDYKLLEEYINYYYQNNNISLNSIRKTQKK